MKQHTNITDFIKYCVDILGADNVLTLIEHGYFLAIEDKETVSVVDNLLAGNTKLKLVVNNRFTTKRV